jgi:hypothetical protein
MSDVIHVTHPDHPTSPGRSAVVCALVIRRARDPCVSKRHLQVYPRIGSLRAAASPLTVTRSRVPMGIGAQWWAGPTCHRQRYASEL